MGRQSRSQHGELPDRSRAESRPGNDTCRTYPPNGYGLFDMAATCGSGCTTGTARLLLDVSASIPDGSARRDFAGRPRRQLALRRHPDAVLQPSPQSAARYILVRDRFPDRHVISVIGFASGDQAAGTFRRKATALDGRIVMLHCILSPCWCCACCRRLTAYAASPRLPVRRAGDTHDGRRNGEARARPVWVSVAAESRARSPRKRSGRTPTR